MRDLILFLATFVFGSFAASVFSSSGSAQVETFRIDGSDLAVEVHKTQAHLFLAEYDFKLVLKAGSEELDSVEMSADTGGLSRIEVLRIGEETIAFRDHGRTECLNIPAEKFKYCDSTFGGERIGYFDFDAGKRWRFIRRDGGRNS